MKYKYHILFFYLSLLSLILLSGCSDDDNEVEPFERMVITNVNLEFDLDGGPDHFVNSFIDPDGLGGNPPTQVDTIVLRQFSFYTVHIEMLNVQGQNDTIDVTQHILEEGDIHRLFFNGDVFEENLIGHEYEDEDSEGYPIGLRIFIVGLNIGEGEFRIMLRNIPRLNNGESGKPTATEESGNFVTEVVFPLKVVER